MGELKEVVLALVGKMDGWQIMVTIIIVSAGLFATSPGKIKAAILTMLRIKPPGGKTDAL